MKKIVFTVITAAFIVFNSFSIFAAEADPVIAAQQQYLAAQAQAAADAQAAQAAAAAAAIAQAQAEQQARLEAVEKAKAEQAAAAAAALGLPVPETKPEIDPATGVAKGYVLAGSCATSYSGSSSNRINNLIVAVGRFNGMIVAPGQAVSVDATILPRTAANGYKMAGVYSDGKTVPGMGGGICQVSSTVYNAVMNAGLTVVKRYPHSMPVHYLPLGQDAAISSGSKDMVFVNSYDTPIIITTADSPATKQIIVNVFVKADTLGGRSYRIYAKKTGGLSADTYRDVYLNGVLVGTEYVGHSTYMAHKKENEE